MEEHPLRRRVVEEMHLRRWPELAVPCDILQILRIVDPAMRDMEDAAFAPFREKPGERSDDTIRHVSGILPGTMSFTWERHTEASTLTLFLQSGALAAGAVSAADSDAAKAIRWAESLPGKVIRATKITIVGDEASAQGLAADLAMDPAELVSCHTASNARIWSDFRIAPDGYGRLVVAANELSGPDLSRFVQRMQELGNYRNLALLGLPVAQDNWPTLNDLEARLNALASDVAQDAATDDQLLARVSILSLELMSLSTLTGYRMNATAAYAQLVEERLEEIAPRRITNFLSLTDFTARRLLPAVRTCTTHTARTAELSQRAERFAALLRTRVETRIENQNAMLLQSMVHSSDLQLRLQQLVEGLSVVALSYYIIGICAYILKGMKGVVPHESIDSVLAIIAPFVVLISFIGIRVLKHRVVTRRPHIED